MIETITLDTRKCYSPVGKPRISPLRRGERNNVTLTVAVRRDRKPYDLAGMTAHLVWQAADGKLVGPVPMEVTDQAAGTVSCTLPDACYAAVGKASAYIELRRGAELVDTTDEMLIDVLDCIDANGEQAEEYKPLIAEVREATDAATKAAARAESGEDERVATESARVTAENSRVSAEDERVRAEDKRAQDSKTILEDLAQAKADAETATGEANAARDEAKKSAADATAAAGKATDAANKATDAATKAVTDAQSAIAEVKATEAKLYPAAENTLKGKTKDTFVHVYDAFAGASLREITVEGACKQNGTPSPDNPVPIEVIEHPVVKVTGKNLLKFPFSFVYYSGSSNTSNGITYTRNDDGSISVRGTAVKNSFHNIDFTTDIRALRGKNLSCGISDNTSKIVMAAECFDIENNIKPICHYSDGNHGNGVVPEDAKLMRTYIYVKGGG